jgi:hypothetical protein
MTSRKLCFWLGIACFPLLLLHGGRAEVFARNKADIVATKITNEEPNLKVSFSVQNCFAAEMEEAIWSGVVTTFRFLAVLERSGMPLVHDKITDVSFEHSIRYDRIRKEFTLYLQEQPQRLRITNDFGEARQWMSEVRDLPLIPLWRLQKGETYRLGVKAELSKVQLPPFLRYIFFWVALWDFETEWHQETFTF